VTSDLLCDVEGCDNPATDLPCKSCGAFVCYSHERCWYGTHACALCLDAPFGATPNAVRRVDGLERHGIRGGQGRTDEELLSAADALMFFLGIVAGGVLVVALLAAMGVIR
jgi:hypothetical protein